jgi:hypothetical protein
MTFPLTESEANNAVVALHNIASQICDIDIEDLTGAEKRIAGILLDLNIIKEENGEYKKI